MDSTPEQVTKPFVLNFDEILSSHVAKSSPLALLLDYDGTLAPIAPHPDLAVMPDETRSILEQLSKIPNVIISVISGRSLHDVKSMVAIEGITFAGSHGFEILSPDGTMYLHPVPDEYQVQLETLKERLKEVSTDGAWVENKATGITFHYREVIDDKASTITTRAKEIFDEVGLKLHQSHKAYEARPPVPWDKGRAAIHILQSLFGEDFRDRVSVIYAGDDETDEYAMKALQGQAITFRITTDVNLPTLATFRLASTNEVLNMLKWIGERLNSS